MDLLATIIKTFGDMVSLQPLLLHIWIGVFILVFSYLLLKLVFTRKFTNYKYRSLGKLFSPAEHSFFLVLKQALSDDEYEIFAKVRIADVLTPESGLSRKNWNFAFYRITSKHFDYVLCSKDTLDVVAVIELDDRSHNLSKTRSRDAFVQKACETAGLKLIRFSCRSNYHIQSVRDKVINSFN